jgi:hypothetical protein
MNKIMLSVLFLTASMTLVLAQDNGEIVANIEKTTGIVPANSVVVDAPAENVGNAIPENMEELNDEILSDELLNDELLNDETLNDEGYGNEDSEYYGDEELLNADVNEMDEDAPKTK